MVEKKYLEELANMKESSAREAIWAYVNDAYIRCQACKGAQKMPYDDGLRTIYRNGWELPHGADVLTNMSRATNLCTTPDLLRRLDEYIGLHSDYDCVAALENIKELREELFEIVSKQNGNKSETPGNY